VDGQPELSLVDAQTAAVVAVIVRNQQGMDVRNISSMGGESGLGLLAADPGVEQEPDAVRLDVDAVAVASRLQGDDFHLSILTLSARCLARLSRNVFFFTAVAWRRCRNRPPK
jgi:hypothetical protein